MVIWCTTAPTECAHGIRGAIQLAFSGGEHWSIGGQRFVLHTALAPEGFLLVQ